MIARTSFPACRLEDIVSSETPVAGSWSRALCIPIFGGVALLALVSILGFTDAVHQMTTRPFVMALATGIAAVLLGGLGLSLVRGRGVPNWFMRTVLISLLTLMFVPALLDILNRWQQGRPINYDDMAFYVMFVLLLVPCFFDSWKTIWFHRSKNS
jgi:hypothetical protein